jgi:hypothetical protein
MRCVVLKPMLTNAGDYGGLVEGRLREAATCGTRAGFICVGRARGEEQMIV